jgi:hypothetical protein
MHNIVRLWAWASLGQAKAAATHGFVGIPWSPIDDEHHRITGEVVYLDEVHERCEFYDGPPLAWAGSQSVTVHEAGVDGLPDIEISAGPTTLSWADFLLSIDVPGELAGPEHEAVEDGRVGERREFWLTPEEANVHRGTLRVWVASLYDPDEEEGSAVPVSFFGHEHGVIVRGRLSGGFIGIEDTFAADALCLCGDEWHWNPGTDEDPRGAFAAFVTEHGTS